MSDTKPLSIDEYIGAFPPEIQAILQKIRGIIHEVAPDAVEKISYAIPAFTLHNRYFIYFSAWQHHIALYPLPSDDAVLMEKLAPYIHGKGTVRFRLDRPIPYKIIRDIARVRAKTVL